MIEGVRGQFAWQIAICNLRKYIMTETASGGPFAPGALRAVEPPRDGDAPRHVRLAKSGGGQITLHPMRSSSSQSVRETVLDVVAKTPVFESTPISTTRVWCAFAVWHR